MTRDACASCVELCAKLAPQIHIAETRNRKHLFATLRAGVCLLCSFSPSFEIKRIVLSVDGDKIDGS